jgi:phage shock protein C
MATEPKKLYRSRSERMIAGVCGGMGKYLGIDATVIRLLFVLLTIFTGVVPGLILFWADVHHPR